MRHYIEKIIKELEEADSVLNDAELTKEAGKLKAFLANKLQRDFDCAYITELASGKEMHVCMSPLFELVRTVIEKEVEAKVESRMQFLRNARLHT